MSAYEQGGTRPLIKVNRSDGGVIAWNWDTRQWDSVTDSDLTEAEPDPTVEEEDDSGFNEFDDHKTDTMLDERAFGA